MSEIEFVALPVIGRRYSHERRVRLSDAGPDGRLRVDGVARYLQDVATDDWDDTRIDADSTWLVRRTAMRLTGSDRWPLLGERVEVTTWCSGSGAAWAERRTNLVVAGQLLLEVVALWVPVDQSGRPKRIRQSFYDVYLEASGGRKVPGRVSLTRPSEEATSRPWTVRQSDLDIVGHANNAAIWSAVVEVIHGPVSSVALTHHGSLEREDKVELKADLNGLWLMVGDDVRVSAEFTVL